MYERLFQLQEETLKTLANQKRLEIVQLLINKELTVSEMVTMLGMPQANLSQHLGILRRYKIVKTRKEGLHVFYSLTDERVARVIAELREFLKIHHSGEPAIKRLGGLGKTSVYPITKDPVCGMRLSAGEAFDSLSHKDNRYYFCASGCRDKFMKHPSQYAKKEVL